ncbi:MAG: hypothetical protein KJ578_03300 [Bacteroidetes bacterium]|nr:hypothetical protein [Bacteroidota bacterium]MBU1578981.1 hypothetical protein [Bacteroidota bacterium]MBU2465637.1 hypothetical protein [Bacteroidota bacterium]MBU2556788.1 hypothetical protein [Bacteroidota bacterium]
MKIKALKTVRHLLLIAFMAISWQAFTQSPPPPPGGPSGGQNTSENRNGGGAPIGSGMLILISLGGAYGGYKAYQHKKNSLLD